MGQLLEQPSIGAAGLPAGMQCTAEAGADVAAGDPRWLLAQRIAASGTLGRSRMLADFLLYVVDRHIQGRSGEITEQQIGVRVFGRPAGYDSNDDNIVRSYARNLRKRLEEYFAGEGNQESLRVAIPRGRYVPVFYPRGEAPAEEWATDELPGQESTLQQAGTSSARDDDASVSLLRPSAVEGEPIDGGHRQAAGHGFLIRKTIRLALGCLLMIGLGSLIGYFVARGQSSARHRASAPSARINHLFWSRLFEDDRDTFVVPTDGGLVMLQRFTKGHVSLEDYANGNYQKDATVAQGIIGLVDHTTAQDTERLAQKVGFLGRRRYTSLADLELTTNLARLPEAVPERLMIRYARDVRLDDLRAGNAILIGSIDSNPWVELFQQQLNFQFREGAEFGGSGTIVNRHPLAGEQAAYASVANDPSMRTYGVAAYVPNLDGTGHVLLIEGINMAATQAAGTFLLHPESMQPVLERALGPDGTIRPFELLFEASSVAANASRTRILSMRVE